MAGKDKGNTKLTRRAILGSAAIGLAGGPAVAGTYVSLGTIEDAWDVTADIVVVGAGAAGCSAAIIAHELGKQVLVLEKGPVVGGTTAKSVGGVCEHARDKFDRGYICEEGAVIVPIDDDEV